MRPDNQLFDRKGDIWEPVGVPWQEMSRAMQAASNLPSSGKKAELGKKPRAREKTPSSAKCDQAEKAAQLVSAQKETEENQSVDNQTQNGATDTTPDCSTPLHPPIYIYNNKKKRECIEEGGEGGRRGARIWFADYVFQTRDKGPRILTEDELVELLQVHGTEAVKRELPRASSWLLANPRRRKASSGLLLFLLGWIQRTVPVGVEKQPLRQSWAANSKPEPKSWRVGL